MVRPERAEGGFTIVEMLITLVILGLFLGLFFQLYMTSQAQRAAVIKYAAANDIAQSNLRKITAKSQLPASVLCDNTTNGSTNKNNGVLNTTLDANTGSVIVTEPDGDSATPEWGSTLAKESITGTSLPSTTQQTLLVSYPRGCSGLMPAKIISIVTYDAESVAHAQYVN